MSGLNSTFETLSPTLNEYLKFIAEGDVQLPEFQRGWVWDDNRIRGIISSVTLQYPIGAIVALEVDKEELRFMPRPFEGATGVKKQPDILILDGQQRMTSLFQSMYSKEAVIIGKDPKNRISRYYYLDMKKCIDPQTDRIDAVISVPEDKTLRDSEYQNVPDLSSRENEYAAEMYPLNIVFNEADRNEWQIGFQEHYGYAKEKSLFYFKFQQEILTPLLTYKIPVIKLLKATPRGAVCQVFEHVNTGGVLLTVFDLLTATYAGNKDPLNLKEDWESKCDELKSYTVLTAFDGPAFLTATTLLSSYKKSLREQSAVSCKREDVLNLDLQDYKDCSNELMGAMKNVAKFLHKQKIYDVKTLPYPTQLIPLAVICAVLGNEFDKSEVQDYLSRWYWSGVIGELYGATQERRYAMDVKQFLLWVHGGEIPATVRDASFTPIRLLSLSTRNSAAYKGITVLMMRHGCLDFINGQSIEVQTYFDDSIDIHHIFPQQHCKSRKYPPEIWNSILNKARTNRILGGGAPSEYIKNICEKHGVSQQELDARLKSHLIDPELLKADNFNDFIADRARAILDMLEKAFGKQISGRDSGETKAAFGRELI